MNLSKIYLVMLLASSTMLAAIASQAETPNIFRDISTTQSLEHLNLKHVEQCRLKYIQLLAHERTVQVVKIVGGVIGMAGLGYVVYRSWQQPAVPAAQQAGQAPAVAQTQAAADLAAQDYHKNYFWYQFLVNAVALPITLPLVNGIIKSGQDWFSRKSIAQETIVKKRLSLAFDRMRRMFELYGNHGDLSYKNEFIDSYNRLIHSIEAMMGFKQAQLEQLKGDYYTVGVAQARILNGAAFAFEGLFRNLNEDIDYADTAPIFSSTTQKKMKTACTLLSEALRDEEIVS